jgi:Putative phage tail protein
MSIFSSSNANLTPQLHSLTLTQSVNGIPVKLLYGTNRVQIDLLFSGDFQSIAQQTPGGKGFGGKDATMWDYLIAVQGALCAGPVTGVPNLWASNGRLTIQGTAETYTVPSAGGSYTVANQSLYAFDQGAARADAYSVTANDYGSPGAITYSGTQKTPMSKVASAPSAAGQYAQSNGTYTFGAADAGKTVTINYSFSLYVLEEQEDYLVPTTSPYEVTVQYEPYFTADMGVIFVDTGEALTYGSGEGQYTQSNGNYLFNAADEGRPVAISYTWNNSQFTTDPTSTLNLTVIEGTQGQQPWSYMQSNHASMALGYSGIALACTPALDCGPSATIPQYNYEVIGPYTVGGGIQDANTADCITDLLTNPLWGARFPAAWIGAAQMTQSRTYWAAASYFISPVLNQQQSCAEIIQQWLDAGNCAAFSSEGLLKILPYGDTTLVGNGATYTPQTAPVVDLTDDDFITENDNDDPVQISRTPPQDAYNAVRVQYNNRLNSYNAEIVEQMDLSAISKFGLRTEGQQNYSFICTEAAASFSANIRLKRIQGIREQYKFTISGIRYWYLEPMDLVTLTDPWLGLNKTPVRIIEIDEDENGNYEITAEQFPWGTATATIYPSASTNGSYPTQATAGPGNVNAPIFFEALNSLTGFSGYELWMGLSGSSPNWGGCHIWMSEDGTNYVQITDVNGVNYQQGQCRMGALTAALPATASPDTTDTLSVSLQQSLGQLQTVTQTQAQQLRTLCYVGGELIAFETATLTGKNAYNLTYLIRGALGTTVAAHAAGTPFLRLDSQPFKWVFNASQIGKTLFFKFTSFNLIQQAEQSLADVVSHQYTITGAFQGAISQNGGAFIGGSGSTAITFNTDFTYTTTTTSITVGGTVTLYLTNQGLSNVTLPVSQTVSGLTAGTEYWLLPYAVQDAYGNWTVQFVANGSNGVTGAVGTPAIAFAGTVSPLTTNVPLTQFYAMGANTPLSSVGGISFTLPTTGTGGGTGGGSNPPVCLHDDMLVDELAHGTITAKRLWELYETGDGPLFLRDGEAWEIVDRVYRAPCRDWCRIRFANGEEAVTTEGHWWLVDSGKLVTSAELEGCMVECDEGYSRAERVDFETFDGHFIRLTIRSKRHMHNSGMTSTKMRTHNLITSGTNPT